MEKAVMRLFTAKKRAHNLRMEQISSRRFASAMALLILGVIFLKVGRAFRLLEKLTNENLNAYEARLHRLYTNQQISADDFFSNSERECSKMVPRPR